MAQVKVCTHSKGDIKNIRTILIGDEPYTSFRLKDMGTFEGFGVGEHIAINASLAILAALHYDNIINIRKNLKNYKGIKKRFDIVDKKDKWSVRSTDGLRTSHYEHQVAIVNGKAEILTKL